MKNDYNIRGEVTEILLKRKTGEIVRALIDTEDLEKVKFVSTWSPHIQYGGKKIYVDGRPYGQKKPVRMHRVIMNPSAEMVIDHINGNSLDNRKSNLRIVTQAENTHNLVNLKSHNKTGVTGVSFNKKNGKWLVQLTVNKVRVFYKLYTDFEEAKDASKLVRAKYMPHSLEARDNEIDKNAQIDNTFNKPFSTNIRSGIRNVYWNKKVNKWYVMIKNKYFGAYQNISDAEKVAIEKRNEMNLYHR